MNNLARVIGINPSTIPNNKTLTIFFKLKGTELKTN
jgi:hypothetical protein